MKSRLHHAPRNDPMKCVQRRDGKVLRVRTEAADDMVATGDFKFVPKSAWKAQEHKEKKAA